MRVVLLLDRPFARRERALISRLEIGLADEGVRVIHAVPQRIIETEPIGLYSRTVGYDDSGFPLPRRARVRHLLDALAAADDQQDSGTEPISLVHAFSPAVWRLGIGAAESLNCAVALEVWSATATGLAAELARGRGRPRLMAADGAVLDRLSRALGRSSAAGEVVHMTPWGVHGEPSERSAAEAVGVVMLLDGVHHSAFEAALTGLSRACRSEPRLLGFVNAGRSASHSAWRLLRRLGATDRISLITDAESRRDAVLRLDALILAEPSGSVRSIALDAMARGVPVLAAADPAVSYLINGVTARIVGGSDADEWERSIAGVADRSSTGLGDLASRARAWVQENRSASTHVGSVLRAYECIIASGVTRPAV